MTQPLDERIEMLIRYYLRWFGLDTWDVTFSYGDYEDGYAGVEVFWFYGQARFHFDLDAIREKMAATDMGADVFLDELCRHEVTHCVLGPLADAAEALAGDHSKGVVTMVENVHESVSNTLSRAPFWKALPAQD